MGQNVGSSTALSNISEITPWNTNSSSSIINYKIKRCWKSKVLKRCIMGTFKISGVVIPESISCPLRTSNFSGVNLFNILHRK
jgi:hypothetical protein